MKSLYVSDIRKSDNQYFEDLILAVTNIELRPRVSGKDAGKLYLFLKLTDKTGSIDARDFDRENMPTDYKIGDPVLVSGTFSQQWGLHIAQVSKFTKRVDPDDFLARCPKDTDEMYADLVEIITSINNRYLKDLLLNIFVNEDIEAKFKTWPAAQEVHHAYIGGLLEHTLTVARICEQTGQLYDVDRDLLVAGALLHDIGKLQELDCQLTITYTDVGSLLGHSVLGCFFVRDKILHIKDFPDQLGQSLLHVIGSHHGRLEWEAIAEPMTLEAFLVCIADDMDAKATRYQTLIEQQRILEQNIGAADYFLGTRVYAPKVVEEEQ